MKDKKFDAVKMKRQLQKDAEKRLSKLSEDKQLQLLNKKYGHLLKNKEKVDLQK